MLSHEYHAGPSGTGVACASNAKSSLASLPKCAAGLPQPTRLHNAVWTLVLRVSVGGFDPQDLGKGGPPDLELALVGLARADDALDLESWPPDRLGQARLPVALAPREHLDGDGRGGQRDRAARH